MAGFGLEAEMSDTVLVRVCMHMLAFEFVRACVCSQSRGVQPIQHSTALVC